MNNEFSPYKSAWWKIDYPSDWIVEKHHECVTFYDDDGVGALQLSAYLKDEKVTREDLDKLISDEIPKDTEVKSVYITEFTGISVEFEDENHFWRTWVLRKEKLLLYITYNCEFDHSEVDRKTINQILNTLECLNHE